MGDASALLMKGTTLQGFTGETICTLFFLLDDRDKINSANVRTQPLIHFAFSLKEVCSERGPMTITSWPLRPMVLRARGFGDYRNAICHEHTYSYFSG